MPIRHSIHVHTTHPEASKHPADESKNKACNGNNTPLTPSQQKQKILRAEASSLNGLETIGLYAASVLAGNYAQLGAATLNHLSLGYLISRAAYTLCYIFIQNRRLSWVRTAVWQISGVYIALFWIKAGVKMG